MKPLNEQILDSWIQLTTEINNERLVKQMPLNEALICRILYQNLGGKITATDLCNMTKMQKSQMNRTLTAMEEKNLILRKRSKEDRRQIFLELNEEKLALYQEQHERIMNIVNKMIERIGEEKSTQALRLFTLISEIAKEEL